MANRTAVPFDVPDSDDLREMTRAVNEAAEMSRAVNPVGEMTRQLREAQAVYQPLPRPEVMRSLASEVESIASALPESVASIPRNAAASRPENLLERTLDRNQKALLRIAEHQLKKLSLARRQLEILRSAGVL